MNKQIEDIEKCSRCKKRMYNCKCSKTHPSNVDSVFNKTNKTPNYDTVMDSNNHNYKCINTDLLYSQED